MDSLPARRLDAAYQTALAVLLAERTPDGHWVGELSASALSTATAISALALVQKHAPSAANHDHLIAGGLAWLVQHQNADGGWGDTVRSKSNISTSMLGCAALHLTGATKQYAACLRRVEAYLHEYCGKTPAEQAEAVRARYGKDRTFAVPILTTCALAGLVEWSEVEPLPFELACLPQSWFRFARLHVVSYALPALIAIGQAVYRHRPPRNRVTRLVRRLSIKKSLRVLEAIQPSSGGFLEATPLTSFVTLSLASIDLAENPVARKAVEFLVKSVRRDGSWAIDSNLATWVTTLSVNALAVAGDLIHLDRRRELEEWLVRQQFVNRHLYTGADPGGWGWTPLPGSVPDADDTPGVLVALAHLDIIIHIPRAEDQTPSGQGNPVVRQANYALPGPAALRGLSWLVNLQNTDGGWPTFCRGWGHLPFDRSGADLTAHALRALARWRRGMSRAFGYDYVSSEKPYERDWEGHLSGQPLDDATARGLSYLQGQQRPDGSWLPLWFGNQHAPNDENPTYGTARVLAAYRDLDIMDTEPARRGVGWLLSSQNGDGGWGGAAGVPSSVEETALAVELLIGAKPQAAVEAAVNNGLSWLVEQVEAGALETATPIGFYFAKLWYFEKLYPIIFTVAALGRARRELSGRPPERGSANRG